MSRVGTGAAGALLVLVVATAGVAAEYQCLYHQRLEPRRAYRIASPGYPANYQAGESCLWIASVTEENARIVLDCEEFDLPPPKNGECGDALWVSLSGQPVNRDGEPHCGSGRFTLVSTGPRLNVKLLSIGSDARGGKFRCSVAALTDPASGPALPSPTPRPPARPPTRPPPPPQRPQPPLDNCTCAVRQPEATRIVGGLEPAPHEYPLIGYLEDGEVGRLLCGAAILSPKYALTAAHCAELAVDKHLVNLVVGDHDRSQPDWRSRRQVLRVYDFVVHPDYRGSWAGADVAVVRLSTQAVLGPTVQPACMPFLLKKANLAGQPVVVLGWGGQRLDGPSSIRLQAARLQVVKNSACSQAYGTDLSDNHLCAFRRDASPCTGDNGGPVVWVSPNTGALHIVGIISYGEGCPGEKPVISTRITHYMRWIQQVTQESFCYVE
ncbi:Venom serine protease 34 [Frankliniella fusca]|uniref:Venom serine protease 34 n=1 Tax=Frankliniella fusca TaxID=407009 RepID=A0AAE1HLA4_9NEOP|nr:Venom serine protease 34 [Frankliniella fusca]